MRRTLENEMFDLIYHRGIAVAHVNLGSVFSEVGGAKIGSLSGGKIYSMDGEVLGSFRNASDPSPDKALSAAFCSALKLAA